MTGVSKKISIDLYKKVYLIRSAERGIVRNYERDVMKSPMHMSMGEEAIVVGVCEALKLRDQVFGTYRSHGLYLSKVGETDEFFAEMYGKKSDIAGGKAGSMFLSRPEAGLMGVSAIVATTIPVAVGAAYANKLKNNEKIVAVFFGDGAIDEGVFWESLNFACLKQLPIIFVCENNGFAIQTAAMNRHGYKSIVDIIKKFNSNVFESSSTDPEIIYILTLKAIDAIKRTNKPSFLHCRYYRYLEHCGVNEDFGIGYRSKREFRKWAKVDPIKVMRRNLLKHNVAEKTIVELENAVDRQVARSIALAESASFPKKSELYKNVFYEKR